MRRPFQGVEAEADLLNGLQSEVGEQSGHQERGEDGDAGEGERGPDPGREDGAQEGGADAHVHAEKGLLLARVILAHDRQHDVVGARGPEEGADGGEDAAMQQAVIVFALR
jgi:hypothetical protein